MNRLLRERQLVGGVRAAFPAMQQHRELAARVAAAFRGAGMKGLQRDAITAIEQQLLARGQQRHGAALDARAPRRQAGQDGLEVPAAQPAPGSKEVVERKARSLRLAWAAGSAGRRCRRLRAGRRGIGAALGCRAAMALARCRCGGGIRDTSTSAPSTGTIGASGAPTGAGLTTGRARRVSTSA